MIHEAWFTFKGIDSREMGAIVTAMPETVRAERRIESITVAGRNGSLHTDEGVYESYDRTMECALIKRAKLDEITAWLVGSGEMTFSTEPDKVYRVTIANKISIAQMMRVFQKFQVVMDTQPFKYSVNAAGDALELTAPTTIRNSGTVYSEPIITVYGSGDITLNINGEDFPIYGVQESITIDSEMMEVFEGDINQNGKYGGAEFPRFEVGKNEISWTGNVSKIKIQPRWRWL
nr:MAG TPA: distal tail protein [Caudoviricetes sp.]